MLSLKKKKKCCSLFYIFCCLFVFVAFIREAITLNLICDHDKIFLELTPPPHSFWKTVLALGY